MENKKVQKHRILGFNRRPSGAFEHSWKLAHNLNRRGFDVDYLAHWWDSPVENIDLSGGSLGVLDFEKESISSGIYHLHTHTWDHDGLLSNIIDNPNSKLLYTLHTIIPYTQFKHKDAFLAGDVSYEEMMSEVFPKMSDYQKFQLSAIEKADCLFVISDSHKKVLERMNVEKPVYVFENVSDVDSLSKASLDLSRDKGLEFRDNIGADNVLLYCGTISGDKGSHRLLEAFQDIRFNHSSSKLILLGADSKESSRVLLDKLPANSLEGVIRVPWVDKSNTEGQMDFLKYYYASDVLIQPMITENLFSKAVIDAMYVGLPTITCKSSYSIGESRTRNDIVESFVYMKDNPLEIEKLVVSAREKVLRENTWDSYISRIEEIVS